MMTSNRGRTFFLILGVLLLANIVLVGFFLLNRPHGQHPDRTAAIAAFLKDEVGFSKEQLQRFDSVSKKHREDMRTHFDGLRNDREAQFRKLAEAGFSDSAISLAVAQNADQQKQMETHMLQNIRETRSICTPQQLVKFDAGFFKLLNRRGDNKKKPEEPK